MNLIEKYSLKRAVDDLKGEIYRGFLLGDFNSIETNDWTEHYDLNDCGHRRVFINYLVGKLARRILNRLFSTILREGKCLVPFQLSQFTP
jgi:hypothetical protein